MRLDTNTSGPAALARVEMVRATTVRLAARRRVQLWMVCVVAVVGVLGLRALVPAVAWPSWPGGTLPAALTLGLFLAAMACEYVDSSLGMGYGTTLTPVLLLAGFEPMQVVPAVLLSECLTGITAGLLHHRDGNVDFWRDRRARLVTSLLLVLTVLGVAAAVLVARHVPKFWLTAIIGAMVLAVGVMILATARRQLRFRPGHLLAVGAIAAFNKGLSGGGYGPLVTGGQVVSGISSKQAVAITSLAEGLTCLVGVIGHFAAGHRVDWALAGPLSLGALLSVPMATLTVQRLPETKMRTGVGLVTCALGVLTLAKLLW